MIFFLLLQLVTADITYNAHDTSIKVLGQSGKVELTHVDSSVQFQVDYLREVDTDGNTVGKSGQNKHSIETFASQNFDFSSVDRVTYKNVSTDKFRFSSMINSIGMLEIDTFLIVSESQVKTETESWNVNPGDVKWNIVLSDWSWCNPCNEGMGSMIDLGIELKSQISSNSNQTVSFIGSKMHLSSRVVVDGVEIDMPEGYPHIVTKNNKQLVKFRFPKFNSKLIYDPVISFQTSQTVPMHQVSMFLVWTLMLHCIQSL